MKKKHILIQLTHHVVLGRISVHVFLRLQYVLGQLKQIPVVAESSLYSFLMRSIDLTSRLKFVWWSV